MTGFLLRVALAELKKGADLAVLRKASLVVTHVVWQVLHFVWKAGQDVEALACSGAFMKVRFKSWTGRLTTHASLWKSRSWALEFHLEGVA